MTSASQTESEVRPSIEIDNNDSVDGQEDVEGSDDGSELGDRTNTDIDNTDPSYEDLDYTESQTPQVDDGGDSSSHHDADEDVFSDKSPRSSLGSYDGVPESGKAHRDSDNMTTVRRSPRISDISQYEREYEKEEFVPTIRGTPRPPFRTPSDVRAMQMSSPPPSVLGSPRSTKRHFPTVSRLGTPSASAHYSPKRMSTPQRFKGRKEAPLVLLHVTLLPLRWVWGDLLNNLEVDEMSDQAKSLRESWRILQDRVGDTVIERGILLGHPQNDYEVLEERLLEALELPLRRRARILECGHYLGPSNEHTIDDDESEDEWSSARSRAGDVDKRHWCGTCKNEIRYDSLGAGKIFRVKVYASNGLMRAGAWAACWKEMERVDVEIEPIVEPAVQEELVRLAAVLQERELAHQEEADIAKEVAHQLEEQHQKERADAMSSRFSASSPHSERAESRMSAADERHRRDEERLREIYGHGSPPLSPRGDTSREPPQPDHFAPPSPTPSLRSRSHERRSDHRAPNHHQHRHPQQRQGFQNASLPELILQSIKVLMQDRKNVIIFTLSVLVLIFALRNPSGPAEPIYEPVIHRMRDMPTPRRVQVVDTTYVPTVEVKAPTVVESVCVQESAAVAEGQATVVESILASVAGYAEPSAAVEGDVSGVKAVESETKELEVESAVPAQETTEAVSSHDTIQSESVAESQESAEATSSSDSPAIESETSSACSQPEEASSAALPESSPSTETTPELPSEPEAAQENNSDAAASSVSTVYEPCPVASEGKPRAVTLQSEETETETVTEKKVVRVFTTVTESKTTTVRVYATDAATQPALLVAMEDGPYGEGGEKKL
ncbi:uncharacterized protein GGS22DRAFT_162634 [Annulohypoxylon maeteangense]|uniref:uncharacterized protein n=1 Tax=Annulohypoxylon maeteangense TaxID=1927788 RepID=UPI002007CBBD|nr:uncharacterized protein GGS22DRAFT_162634 [Annulohypoxylon maeteangense]KAI0885059.1 hypothetical protein GGS22DRAFT_162634 [Annulohypoxylon maeteangense]